MRIDLAAVFDNVRTHTLYQFLQGYLFIRIVRHTGGFIPDEHEIDVAFLRQENDFVVRNQFRAVSWQVKRLGFGVPSSHGLAGHAWLESFGAVFVIPTTSPSWGDASVGTVGYRK